MPLSYRNTYIEPIQLTFDPVTGFAVNTTTGLNGFDAKEYIDQVLTLVGTGTVTFFASNEAICPDFTIPSAVGNSYVTVVTADYSIPNTYYAGATGVTVAGATTMVEYNTNLITWIAIQRSVNTVDVLLTQTNNA